MHTDVIICGGALAGMTLALSLQKKGFDVLLVDPRSVRELMQQDKRTTAIAAGPRKFFDDLGVWNKLESKAEAINTINILDGSSSISLVFDYKDYVRNNISTSIKSLGHVVENSDLIKQIDLTTKNLKKCGKVKRINSKVLNIKVDKFSAKVFLENNKIAVLQGLDKVTARISTLYVSIDENVLFGTLSINVRACFKTPPTEPPESIAFIEIHKIIDGRQVANLFTGWMFASSPALSALEHAVYDVWVVDCTNSSNSSNTKTPPPPAITKPSLVLS